MTREPVTLIFELARTDTPENPYAFRYGPQDYTLRTKHGGRKRVHMDWSESFLADLDALHQPYCDPAVAQRIGRCLYTFLEGSSWAWHAQIIAGAVQQGTPVLVTIRSAAAELYALPWELLPLEATGQCVGELPGVLVRYEWPDTHSVPAKHLAGQNSARGAGRTLVAWSAAAGSVPAAEHIEAIQTASRAGARDFRTERDVLANVSVGKLADALESGQTDGHPVSILHLLCHGGRAGKTWGMMFNGEDEDDDAVAVDAWRLRQLLAPHAGTLRLVVITACGSAYGREFDSVAQALHRAGIQAVVASRFPLSQPGSIRVAKTLYESMMAHHRSLEEAFLRVRKYLARDAARLDWAGLQLYARMADGHTTSLTRIANKEPPQAVKTLAEGPPVQLDRFDLPALLELRHRLSSTMSARFESQQALLCVQLADLDFHLNSDEPGLQERCRTMLMEVSTPVQGRIFASRSDRFQACFPSVRVAIKSVFGFLDAITEHNYNANREEQLIVRIGLHYGPVLSNGKLVSGDSLDVATRMADAADNSVIMLSRTAYDHAPRITQAHCRLVSSIQISGSSQPMEVYNLPWREAQRLPSAVVIEETEEEHMLPQQDVISFGRLDTLPDGTRANDIILTHGDESAQLSISRWHFELRRIKQGYVLRALSSQLTEVDDQPVRRGEEIQVSAGTVVRLARVMTLHFRGPRRISSMRKTVTVHEAT